MDNNKIIEKIQKCLDLAKSSNPNEAAAALRHAQGLMKKFGVSEVELQLAKIAEATSDNRVPQRPKKHVWGLITLISDAFTVKGYTLPKPHVNNKGRVEYRNHVVFVGNSASAELAKYAFDVCIETIKMARREYSKSVHGNCSAKTREQRLDSFSEGFVYGVRDNVTIFAMSQEDSDLIDNYVAVQHGEVKSVMPVDTKKKLKGKKRGTVLGSSLLDGLAEGEKVSLHVPVHGKESRKLTRF